MIFRVEVLIPFKPCEHKVVLQIRKILSTPEIRKTGRKCPFEVCVSGLNLKTSSLLIDEYLEYSSEKSFIGIQFYDVKLFLQII